MLPKRLVDGEYAARLAPSIALRGEQLFNLDIPRFAVRVYLSQDGSFVNLRRMVEMTSRLNGEQWIRLEHHSDSSLTVYVDRNRNATFRQHPDPPSLKNILTRFNHPDNVVADCVLIPKQSLNDEFEIVLSELGWVYGESRSIMGVSYVRAVKGFSGGACAQAACFMAATMMHEYLRPASIAARTGGSVHGLAEITALIHSQMAKASHPSVICLKGLSIGAISEYFALTGRTLFQYAFSREIFDAAGNLLADQARLALDILRVHISSGFCPILAVAQAEEDGGVLPDKVNHAVLAIGISKIVGSSGRRERLLVNDPSRHPFDTWDIQDFRERAFRPDSTPIAVCALPFEVRIPLTTATIYRFEETADRVNNAIGVGIFEIACLYSNVDESCAAPSVSDFRLVQLHISRPTRGQESINAISKAADSLFGKHPAIRSRWTTCGQLRQFEGKWCWLQLLRSPAGAPIGFRVWDAELTAPRGLVPDDCAALTNRIIASATIHDPPGMYATSEVSRPRSLHHSHSISIERAVWGSSDRLVSQTDRALAQLNRERRQEFRDLLLKPSLITSCSATRLGIVLNPDNWPQLLSRIELYAFMHCDDELFGYDTAKLKVGELPSVAKLFSDIYRSQVRDADRWLRNLARRILAYAETANAQIGSVATHLPQLFSTNLERFSEAENALLAIARLTRFLPEKHRFRTMVLSAGNIVHGLFLGQEEGDDEDIILARLRPRRFARQLILKRLTSLCERADRDGVDRNFSFALELEPGPLFSISCYKDMHEMAKAIELSQNSSLKRRVGFNVDIAHCAIAGIDPDVLFADSMISNRICNFHVSDQGSAHFGDAPLGECMFCEEHSDKTRPSDLLTRWIEHAVKYAAKRQSGSMPASPSFSGSIAIELEAALHPEQAQASAEALCQLLSQAESKLTLPSDRRPPGMFDRIVTWARTLIPSRK